MRSFLRIVRALAFAVRSVLLLAWGRRRVAAEVRAPWEARFRADRARRMLRLLRIEIEVVGEPPPPGPLLVVSNHLGYVDIPLLNAVLPVRFVSKEEVAGWPLVGWIATMWGTLYVRRGTSSALGGFLEALAAGLRAGHAICVFPEGTSTDGSRILPFKTGVFAALEDGAAAQGRDAGTAARLLPVHLRIVSIDGAAPTPASRERLAWFGDDTLVAHMLRLGALREARVRVAIGTPLEHRGLDRKALARLAEEAVRALDGEVARPSAPRAEELAPSAAPPTARSPVEGSPTPVATALGETP